MASLGGSGLTTGLMKLLFISGLYLDSAEYTRYTKVAW